MKKLIIVLCILMGSIAHSQIVLDALEFQGKVTNTIRDAYVIPTGGSMFIWSLDDQNFQYAADDQVWHVMEIYTTAEKSKLAGIEPGATADQSDAEIEAAYNNQVPVMSQVEAEAGTSTAVRRITAERIAQAIAALAAGGGTDDQVAAEVSITDAGDYYTATDVEGMGQEIGALLGSAVQTDDIENVAYGPGWEGDLSPTTKGSLFDKFETMISDVAESVGSDNILNGDLLFEDFNLTGTLTDGYFLTYNESTGGGAVVAPPSLSLGGTGNGTLSISYGNSVDFYSITGVNDRNISLHPDSQVTTLQAFVGDQASITAAGLGAGVLTFRTDAPPALTETGNHTASGDFIFNGGHTIPSQTLIAKDAGGAYAILRFKINGVERWLKGDGTYISYGSAGSEERLLTETDYGFLEERSFVIPITAVGGSISVGTFKNFVPVHDAITITRVEAHLNTAPTGSTAIFDINEDGTTILSTELSIDGTENYSDTAASQAVISDSAIDARSVLSVDVVQAGSSTPGADGTITIYYTKP